LNRRFGKSVIHVETPYLFGNRLLNHVKSRRGCKCYCLSPVNYDYVMAEFGISMSRQKYKLFLIKYYKELGRFSDLQLHVHLSQYPDQLSEAEKKKRILDSYNFFVKDLGIQPKEILFGWYTSDRFSEEISRSLGLKIRGRHLHLYDRWIK